MKYQAKVVGHRKNTFLEHSECDRISISRWANNVCERIKEGLFGDGNVYVVIRDENKRLVYYKHFNLGVMEAHKNCYAMS